MIDTLQQLLPNTKALHGDFAGCDGYTGRGQVRCLIRANMSRKVTISLKGIGGTKARIHIDGQDMGMFMVKDGASAVTLDSAKGDGVPPLYAGAPVEVFQNDMRILKSALG